MKLYLQVLQLSVVNKISVCYILQACLVLDVTDEWKGEGQGGKREGEENESCSPNVWSVFCPSAVHYVERFLQLSLYWMQWQEEKKLD